MVFHAREWEAAPGRARQSISEKTRARPKYMRCCSNWHAALAASTPAHTFTPSHTDTKVKNRDIFLTGARCIRMADSQVVRSLFVTLRRSTAGKPWMSRRIIEALGLSKPHECVEKPNNASIRGMLMKVRCAGMGMQCWWVHGQHGGCGCSIYMM